MTIETRGCFDNAAPAATFTATRWARRMSTPKLSQKARARGCRAASSMRPMRNVATADIASAAAATPLISAQNVSETPKTTAPRAQDGDDRNSKADTTTKAAEFSEISSIKHSRELSQRPV